MKPTTSYRFRGSWSYLITACIAFLSILYRSDVLAATLRIPLARSNVTTSSAISPYRLSSTATPIPINQPEGLQERVPNDILAEILHLDNLKCFPKLLCTIYQDPQVTRQGFFVNSTELALAYIKLIRAVHYTSPSRTTTEAPRKRKKPIIQVFKIPHGLITASTNLGRKDHLHRIFREDDDLHDNFPRYPYPLRSPASFYNDQDEDDDDSYNYFYGRNRDDEEAREFLREKVQISQLMKDLKDEDNDELLEDSPDGLATTLLSSYLPFVGSRPRRRRERSVYTYPRISHRSGRRRSQKRQDPFWKAVTMWKKLKRRNECQALYKTCPFEAWEIVRMLDLVRGQANVLSAYLKITVDKVKPKRKRQ